MALFYTAVSLMMAALLMSSQNVDSRPQGSDVGESAESVEDDGLCLIRENELSSVLNNCYRYSIGHPPDQMCRPLQDVILCTEDVVEASSGCPWMTEIATEQAEDGLEAMRKLRVEIYGCTDD